MKLDVRWIDGAGWAIVTAGTLVVATIPNWAEVPERAMVVIDPAHLAVGSLAILGGFGFLLNAFMHGRRRQRGSRVRVASASVHAPATGAH